MLEGRVRLYPRARRVKMVDSIPALLSKLHVGTSVVAEDDDSAFLAMVNATGGFFFRERADVVQDVSRMRNYEQRSAASETTMRLQTSGRGTQARIREARGVAMRAATGNVAFTSQSCATALLKHVCGVRRPPDFVALRETVLSAEQLLQIVESLNPAFVNALLRIEGYLNSDRTQGVLPLP